MRSGKRLLLTGLLFACLAALPAVSEARTEVRGHIVRHASAVHTVSGTANCDADVFLYNYRPRKAKS